MYSQPSPTVGFKHPRLEIPRSSSIYHDDVSPPDSPQTLDGGRSKKSSPNVSPITETGRSLPDLPQKSGDVSVLPAPPQSSGSTSYISGWREKVTKDDPLNKVSKTTRWDDFSGEPTNSDSGKPAQVIPGTTQFDVRNESPLGRPILSSSGHQPKPSLSDRLRKVGKKEPRQSTFEREEWKGASGRTTIIKPLVDKPLPPGKTPVFAAAGVKYPDGRKIKITEKKTSAPSKHALRTERKSYQSLDLSDIEQIIKPIVPLKIGKNSPRSPLTPASMQRREANLEPDNTRSPLAQNPSVEQMLDGPDDKGTSAIPTHNPVEKAQEHSEGQTLTAAKNMHFENEPASRFSGTTYNTTFQDSPPATPELSFDETPPLPTPPSSVLHRKRPVAVSGISMNKPTTRKPTPSEISSANKSLPQSPPEAEAVDRISSLEAKLDTLNRRRANLQTVIHELTHVVQPSSIAYDIASRQEIKKTVDIYNTESAAVAKEIHETGLMLHRAMKRRDEKSMYEPTGLWVRRVTE